MHGYFLYNDHIIMISVDEYYFKPMQNPYFAKYKAKWIKVLKIKTLQNEFVKSIDKFDTSNHLYKYCEVDYYPSEQQILDSLPKENGYIRLYYDSGNIKEKYFVKDGDIVEGTHRFYNDK
jgi:hypothetical protein